MSPKRGVSEGASHGVSLGPLEPWASECPRSVPRVSPSVKKVSWTLGDTLRTLLGHSGTSDSPRFRGHARGHSPAHFGPEGPEETPVAGRGARKSSPFRIEESSPMRKISGRISRGCHSGARPGSKTSGRPSKPWKTSIWVRASMTPDVHDLRGGSLTNKLRPEKLQAGLLFPTNLAFRL